MLLQLRLLSVFLWLFGLYTYLYSCIEISLHITYDDGSSRAPFWESWISYVQSVLSSSNVPIGGSTKFCPSILIITVQPQDCKCLKGTIYQSPKKELGWLNREVLDCVTCFSSWDAMEGCPVPMSRGVYRIGHALRKWISLYILWVPSFTTGSLFRSSPKDWR